MTFPGQKALDDVTIELAPGEIHALVGENGSGKSTMIKILSGFYSPDPGSKMEVNGFEVPLSRSDASKAAGLRFVHQDLGLINEMTTVENIGLTSAFVKSGIAIDWKAQRSRARELLQVMGVDVDVDLPVGELSAVQRTAIAIGRAIDPSAGEISVLVLDEPTAALPPADVEILGTVLRKLRSTGITIFYVSHRLGEVLDFADRITVLKDGRSPGTFESDRLDTRGLAELIVGRAIEGGNQSRGTKVAREDAEECGVRFEFSGVTTSNLRNVQLAVRRGEILGIAGIAGSGREQLARALAAAMPTEGRIRRCEVGGAGIVSALSEEAIRELGVVLVLSNRDSDAAVLEFTIRENMTLPILERFGQRGRIETAKESEHVRMWIERLGVQPPVPDRTYGFLSGGNKQKVVMARGLMRSPELLVLDDPTSGVDVGARQAIYRQIQELATGGIPVIVCSADIEDLVAVSDRVLIISHGQVTTELSGTEVNETDLLASIA